MVQVNGTSNFETKPYDGVKQHNLHDPHQNHENKNIVFDLTKYNRSGTVLNYDSAMSQQYGQYVKDHDAKALESRHPDRVYGSVDNYIKQVIDPKNKGVELRAVFTSGDYETKLALLEELKKRVHDTPGVNLSDDDVEKLYFTSQAKGLESFARGFNHRHKAFKIGEYSAHVDEKGSPHLHAEVFKMGHTGAKNKPSGAWNAALREEYGKKDSRACLRAMRDDDDREIVKHTSRALKDAFKSYGVKVPSFTFTRKPDHNDELDQDSWTKAQKRVSESIANAEASLADERKSVANAKRSIYARESYNVVKTSEAIAKAETKYAYSAISESTSAGNSYESSANSKVASMFTSCESTVNWWSSKASSTVSSANDVVDDTVLTFKTKTKSANDSVALAEGSLVVREAKASNQSTSLTTLSNAIDKSSEAVEKKSKEASLASSAVDSERKSMTSRASSMEAMETNMASVFALRYEALGGQPIMNGTEDVTDSMFDPHSSWAWIKTFDKSHRKLKSRERKQYTLKELHNRLHNLESDITKRVGNMSVSQRKAVKSAYSGHNDMLKTLDSYAKSMNSPQSSNHKSKDNGPEL